MVNSLHGQGIDRLADDFVLEAITEDGVIEGIRLANDPTLQLGCNGMRSTSPKIMSYPANSSKRSALQRECDTRQESRGSPATSATASTRLALHHPGGGETAIGAVHVSRHKAGVITSQKRCDSRNLIRCSVTLERHPTRGAIHQRSLALGAGKRRAGRYGVEANIVFSKFDGHGLREVDDAGFARAIGNAPAPTKHSEFDATLTMAPPLPWATNCRAAHCPVTKAPYRLVLSTRFHSSSLNSKKGSDP